MEETIKKLEEKKKRLEILVDKLNTIIYDLKDYEDLSREEEIPIQNTGIIKVVGEKQKEKDRIEALNTEQRIKPIKIDIKNLKKKEKELLRKRYESIPVKRKNKKKTERRKGIKKIFTDEIDKFLEKNWESNTDIILKELIEEKFDRSYSVNQIKGHRKYLKLVANRPGRKKAILNTEGLDLKYKFGRKKGAVGKPKKYTNEAVQFLRENINNFKNKELCEELESRFNIKTDPIKLGVILSHKGIKRDIKSELDQEIIDFIKKSKTKDAHALREKIIEKFEKNISMTKIREFIKKDLPGEGVKDEVKRIKEISKLESIEADSIDDMDLD